MGTSRAFEQSFEVVKKWPEADDSLIVSRAKEDKATATLAIFF
jgi:hypothetical protein